MKTPINFYIALIAVLAFITPTAMATPSVFDGTPLARTALDSNTPIMKTIPAGTPIMVRTNSTLDTRMNIGGSYFPTTLAADIVVDGQVVIPRGTFVQGYVREATRAGNIGRRATLKIELTDISQGEVLMPIVTAYQSSAGEEDDTAGKTGAGAAIGGILGGWSGVAKGAAIGFGVSAITKGKQIEIPAGTLLEFRLQQPISLEVIN